MGRLDECREGVALRSLRSRRIGREARRRWPHADLERARAAKERAKVLFARKASVVGIGINRVGDGFGVKVNLANPPPPDADLPETIDGVPVLVEVVGTIRKR